MPKPPTKKAKDVGEPVPEVNADVTSGVPSVIQEGTEAGLDAKTSAEAVNKTHGDSSKQTPPTVPWPDSFSTHLAPFLSTEKIEEVKQMFLEGPEPPFVSDTGWSGRLVAKANESGASGSMDIEENIETKGDDEGKKGSNKRGRDRGGRPATSSGFAALQDAPGPGALEPARDSHASGRGRPPISCKPC